MVYHDKNTWLAIVWRTGAMNLWGGLRGESVSERPHHRGPDKDVSAVRDPFQRACIDIPAVPPGGPAPLSLFPYDIGVIFRIDQDE